jgi:hypothetical protein
MLFPVVFTPHAGYSYELDVNIDPGEAGVPVGGASSGASTDPFALSEGMRPRGRRRMRRLGLPV